MASRKKPAHGEPLAAQVVLRSATGRSLSELATQPLPKDLSPFLPTTAARGAVTAAFTQLGFRVHEDEQGVSLSIEAPAATFRRVFGLDSQAAAKATARQPVALQAPPDIAAHIDAITLLVPPDWMQD